ncbi:DUF6600 domain-containing protein [Verrucomicrobium spinosum]|uniref:DUF6600 domain-containing protein n=1 Tax=Verrucomicrobium spinosum TaxID=2736 RepID=UPI0012E232A6|nr:DUF6600 domain-containing protein [Verrucomicrobium spinosum]
MKTLPLLLLSFALWCVALPPRAVQAQETVSFELFYESLDPYGEWIGVDDYGYCWRPYAAVDDPMWRPYSDGSWAHTDGGWTWVSNEDFGWATYHYGRWARVIGVGWVWVPGYEWAPAWVSWRDTPDKEYVAGLLCRQRLDLRSPLGSTPGWMTIMTSDPPATIL